MLALAIHFARNRGQVMQELEVWRGRYDAQSPAMAAAEAKIALMEGQRSDLEGQATREREARIAIDASLIELRTRLEEQQRAADQRFTDAETKRTQIETTLEGLVAQKAETETALNDAQRDRAMLEQRLSALTAERAAEREHLDAQIATLKQGREAMTKEFTAIADELMRKQSEDLRKSAGEQLVGIVTPLKEGLGKFEGEMRTTREEAIKERTSLKEQLFTLTKQSEAVSKEAETLSKALRGDNQAQGAWGEAILSRLLEMAGLQEGREYTTQESFTDEQGRRLRPDVVVTLPGDNQLIIDSKVSLVAYDQAVNAETEADRTAALSRHVLSIQNHIKGLASKEYAPLAKGSADYVIMFIPIEGALSEALRTRGDLTEFALERHVMIATPTTLMMALRTIKNVWEVERRSKNAEEIAKRAGALFDKVVGFTASLEEVGKHLDKAKSVHDQAVSQLSTGRGNLLGHVEKLKKLGAKTNKSLPDHLLDDDQTDETPALSGHKTPQ